MSRLEYSKNRDKYVRDIIDVAWLGYESERGYMDFQKHYAIVLRVSENIDSNTFESVIEKFWVRSWVSKEQLINNIKKFIDESENVTVKDLVRIEARETTFD